MWNQPTCAPAGDSPQPVARGGPATALYDPVSGALPASFEASIPLQQDPPSLPNAAASEPGAAPLQPQVRGDQLQALVEPTYGTGPEQQQPVSQDHRRPGNPLNEAPSPRPQPPCSEDSSLATSQHNIMEDWGAADHILDETASVEDAYYRLDAPGGGQEPGAAVPGTSAAGQGPAAADVPETSATSLPGRPLTQQQLELKRVLSTVVPFDASHFNAASNLPGSARHGLEVGLWGTHVVAGRMQSDTCTLVAPAVLLAICISSSTWFILHVLGALHHSSACPIALNIRCAGESPLHF